ncbi:hypothetical protein [Methanococcoides methylutens]|uniref:Uncharacterized protein n=1 Tax=Methanococcoides methylutens MM1 TaxID=1434104 RepID=A0A0E3X054_METMT|nr:hypothetical protein [Methanococcoides methylutens]AKB85514.1 hypothetical protein MCMEM_1461 [Methanococcoides methylutens MM1]
MEPLTIVIVAVILLFPILLVKEARKQKKTSMSVFESYAISHGWTYMQKDDGTIQKLAKDFQSIGRFNSPSLGNIIPENVVIGSVPEGKIYLFQHYVRIYEGNALQLDVCILELEKPIIDRLIIRFKKGKSRLTNDLYTMPELDIDPKWTNDVAIYKNDPKFKDVLDDSTLTTLVQKANNLPWRTDLQIKNNLLAVYIAERNSSVESENDLSLLIDFARYTVDNIQET